MFYGKLRSFLHEVVEIRRRILGAQAHVRTKSNIGKSAVHAIYDLAFLSILSPLYSCQDQCYILFVGTFGLRLCGYVAQVAQSWIVAGMSYLT
jgi:hypothetical protein